MYAVKNAWTDIFVYMCIKKNFKEWTESVLYIPVYGLVSDIWLVCIRILDVISIYFVLF